MLDADWKERHQMWPHVGLPIGDVMRFRLVYHGLLRSSGNNSKLQDVRDMRDQFHDQMLYLWETHRALHRLQWSARVPGKDYVGAFLGGVDTPLAAGGPPQAPPQKGFVDLTASIEVNGRLWKPLVRKDLDLTCSLNILMLRKQDPGELVTQGGDLDGRVKTLLDALRMPSRAEDEKCPSAYDHVFCLMENDSLVSHLEIETDRLLFPKTEGEHEVYLVVEVSVNVHVVGEWNVCLLG